MADARAWSVTGLALAGWLALAVPSSAQLKVEIGADGLKRITDEGSSPRHPHRPAAARRPAAVPALLTMPELEIAVLVDRYSARHGLDPKLVEAVIETESDSNPRALSRKGAMGLMQLMPATARDFAVSDPWDPEQNVRAGTAYLARLLDRFGRLDLALAAYNAGPEVVERHRGVPPYPETRAYVARVLRLYARDASETPPPARRTRKVFMVRRPGEPLLLTTEPWAGTR